MLLAGRRYHDRPHILESVLGDFNWFIRFKRDACGDLEQMLDITVLAMERYCDLSRIQLLACIILIHLLNPEIEQLATTTKFNCLVKGRVLKALLDSMWKHCRDDGLLVLNCTVLWQFLVLDELPPLYERILVGSNQSFIFHHFRIAFFQNTLFFIVKQHLRDQEDVGHSVQVKISALRLAELLSIIVFKWPPNNRLKKKLQRYRLQFVNPRCYSSWRCFC